MDERSQRIVKTAIDLAEEGGFEAVRLRDVAAHAKVALGTVYKRFRSKEDMLVAALAMEVGRLQSLINITPPVGVSAEERIRSLFSTLTTILAARPKFSQAVIRAVASGEPEMADKVLRFHSQMVTLIVGAINTPTEPTLTEDEAKLLAHMLQQIWFAGLVGWMGGLHEPDEAVRQVTQAARLMLAGMQSLGEGALLSE
ncbi:MAG: TetR/AcrR family transcriptional regulator [Myxococcota bacterium]|nr:TetR/AcrR family transcriptional regulator [Myxococcota bacterium]